MVISNISLDTVGAVLAATSALSTAAFGLLDSLKVFAGGPSNFGTAGLHRALLPFAPALDAAVGADAWWTIVRANWIAGVPKADQKAKVEAIIRLGLTSATAPALAEAGHVDAAALQAATGRIERGEDLSDSDLNILGRMNAVVDAILDAAFERADQLYKNWSRVSAGAIAILASLAVWWFSGTADHRPGLGPALLIGVLAVPLAPIAKDLTSALSTAARAYKAARQP